MGDTPGWSGSRHVRLVLEAAGCARSGCATEALAALCEVFEPSAGETGVEGVEVGYPQGVEG